MIAMEVFSVSIVAGIVIGMLILIGVFVYRDAKKRNMNSVAWTAIAVLAPALIGFIAYLIVSRSITDLKCPKCEASITDKYVICPVCGAKLKPLCKNCSTPVEPHWNKCPMCTKPLDGFDDDVVYPKAPRDNVLRNILIVIILVPFLFISFVLVSSSISASMSVGFSSISSEILVEEFLEQNNDERVKDWLNDKEYDYNPRCAYALEYKSGDIYSYLIYVPRAGEGSGANFQIQEYTDEWWNGRKIRFYLGNGNFNKDVVYCLELEPEADFDLEIFFNNEELKLEITQVDFDPLQNMFE